MRTCPRCGTENPPEANFCLWCGAALRTRIGGEERKVITVLFCDLAGFTAVAERMDPEDVGATLRSYHTAAKEQIEGFGGTVEKFLGDGVIGVFGMPVAHEDDPERALRAALRIVDAVAEVTSARGLDLPVRIGVTTGEALVSTVPGEQVGGSIAGDVVNTAARLQAAAPANGILAGEATHRATASEFVYEPHEPIRAKGKTRPITVWRPLRPRGRIGVDRDVPDAAMIGREAEREILRTAFREAIDGPAAATVLITGDAGVGKSRLVRDFSLFIEALPVLVRWRRGRCLPWGDGVRFWAIGEILKAQADILDTDEPGVVAVRVEESLAGLDIPEDERGWLAGVLAPLVGLPGPPTPPTREELFAGIRRLLTAMAAERPTILVFEDLQWADDAMLDLLGSLVTDIEGVPLFVVCVARTEIDDRHPGWSDAFAASTRIPLDILTPAQSRSFVQALAEEEPLPTEVVEAIVDRAGGNPLFAEEFVRMLRDRGLVDRGTADLPMPESLRSLAAARLDALPPDLKSVVLDASVVGNVFWSGAVAAVGETDPAEIEARLPFLLRRHLVERRDRSSVEGEAEFAFRSDVTVRVAYDQIPRASRSHKHRNAAAWVRRLAGERVSDVAEELAHHLEQALALSAVADPALTAEVADATVLVAGRLHALDAPAAVRAYERALDLLPADAPGRGEVVLAAATAAEAVGRFDRADAWYRDAIDVFLATGEDRLAGESMGHAARSVLMQGRVDEADALLARAVETLEPLPPGPELARVCARMAGRWFIAGEYDAAMAWVTRTLDVAVDGEPRDAVAIALQYRGSVRAERGEAEGMDDLREAIRLAREDELTDVLGVGLGNLAYLTWFREGPAAALEIAQEIEAFGASRGFGVLQMWGKAAEIESWFDLGEWDRVLHLAAEMRTWDAKHGPSQIGSHARFGAAWVRIRRGDTNAAIELIDETARDPASTGLPEFRATTAAMRAVISSTGGDVEGTRRHLEEFRDATGALPEVRVHLLPVVVRAAVAVDLADAAATLVPKDPGPPIERRRMSHETALAILREDAGDAAEALAAYADLAARWEAFGFPLEAGQCRLGEARCLRALGREEEMGAKLIAAREHLAPLGARPLVDEIERLAASVGYAADSMAGS